MKKNAERDHPDRFTRRDYLKAAGVAGVSGSLVTATNPLSLAQDTTNTNAEPIYTHSFEDGPGFDTITGWKVPGNAHHTTSTAHSGSGSLQVDIPRGSHTGIGGKIDPVEDGLVDGELTSLYASYWVKFAPDFESDSNGGKLPGPSNTEPGGGQGGDASTGRNGWSARGKFDGENGEIGVGYYCYHMDMSGTYGDHFNATTVPRGEWHHIEEYIELNTTSGGSANADGRLVMWVNGEKHLDKQGMRFTEEPERGVNFYMNVYYGGNDPSPADNTMYFDDLVIAPAPTDASLAGGWSPEDYAPGASNQNPDTTTDYPNTLTIVDNQSQKDSFTSGNTEYSFTVSGDIKKTTDMDATKDDEDTIEGCTVSGVVGEDADSYAFGGNLTAFEIDGDATLYINEEQVSPNTLTDLQGVGSDAHTVTFDGTAADGPVDYSFTATEAVESGADDDNDTVSDGVVEGTVDGDIDEYLFRGNLTEVRINGNATMSVTRGMPVGGDGGCGTGAGGGPGFSGDALLTEPFEDSSYTDWFNDKSPGGGTYHEISSEQAQAGESSLKVPFPSGSHDGFGGRLNLEDKGLVDAPVQELYASFWVYFPEDFTCANGEGKKLPGPVNYMEDLNPPGDSGNNGDGHGGDPSTGYGWSTRASFRKSNADEVELADYTYHMDMGGTYGDHHGKTWVSKGEWHKIEQYVKLNTTNGGSANNDGILQMWIDGEQLVDEQSMRWTERPDEGIEYEFIVWYGGNTPSPKDQALYIDNWELAAKPATGDGQSGTSQ